MNGIVVGVDGSAHAAQALRWAAREGDLHGWPVRAVLAWDLFDQPHAGAPDGPGRFEPTYDQSSAEEVLETIVAEALGAGRARDVDRLAVCDLPAPALLDAGAGAELLVVGARGVGGFKGLLLGSVSQHVLHHSVVPVAVVRGLAAPDIGGRVVVGVDGSPTSKRALAWAVDEAGLRRAALTAVTAWHPPYGLGGPFASMSFDSRPYEEAAGALLDAALDGVDTSGLPDPPQRAVRLGSAAGELLDVSRGSDLVVLGSRGLGALAGMVLGSVTSQVALHADCTVVVLPPAH